MKALPYVPMEYVKASGPIKESDVNSLLDKVQAALIQTVSKLLKVRVEDIEVDAELNEYGFDSILFTQLTNLLNEEYKLELIPTVFFEYPTIQSFSKHMIEEYQEAFASLFSVKVEMLETSNQVMKNEIVGTIISKERKSRFVKTVGLLESCSEQAVSE
ncbi:acyl carrier protein, partial [Bacillus wiedmannii]|uniref:acyl carrier protein n=1 Tax=Bacillus wiedmannii TaxID=1890302 RepID=UPI00211D5A67